MNGELSRSNHFGFVLFRLMKQLSNSLSINWVAYNNEKKNQQLEISLNQLASKYLLFKMMLWLPHATIWLRFHSFVMLSLQRTFLIESPISLDVFIWWIVCQSTTCELILCFVLLFSRLFFLQKCHNICKISYAHTIDWHTHKTKSIKIEIQWFNSKPQNCSIIEVVRSQFAIVLSLFIISFTDPIAYEAKTKKIATILPFIFKIRSLSKSFQWGIPFGEKSWCNIASSCTLPNHWSKTH